MTKEQSRYHLAQLNIGKIIASLDSPVMQEFTSNLDRINSLAEDSKGFVWRFKGENNNATDTKLFDDDLVILNLSVWERIEDLFQFTYKTAHTHFLRRRREWFEKMPDISVVLWYVDAGTLPTAQDAADRLAYLRKHGETPLAFTFSKRYTVEEYTNLAAKEFSGNN